MASGCIAQEIDGEFVLHVLHMVIYIQLPEDRWRIEKLPIWCVSIEMIIRNLEHDNLNRAVHQPFAHRLRTVLQLVTRRLRIVLQPVAHRLRVSSVPFSTGSSTAFEASTASASAGERRLLVLSYAYPVIAGLLTPPHLSRS